MKILVCDKMDAEALESIKKLPGAEVTVKTGMDAATLKTTIPDYEVAIVRGATKVRKEAIDAAKNLKVIIRGGVGLDNIDVEYARSKGIQVRNTPKSSAISVAELALGMMFSLARSLNQVDRAMKDGKWDKREGFELYEKTLCIIGCGNIGIELGTRAVALGMKVIYTDIVFRGHEKVLQHAMKLLCKVSHIGCPGDELNIVGLDEAIATADIISLHIPFDKAIGPVLGEAEFAKMKNGVMLINAARGGVVRESALIAALKSGKVAAAGIDVYEEEPTKNKELVAMPQVLCTSHIGASTLEGQARVGVEVVEIVREYCK